MRRQVLLAGGDQLLDRRLGAVLEREIDVVSQHGDLDNSGRDEPQRSMV